MTHLHWYRNDLRTDDHPALDRALEADAFLPVYVLDPARFRMLDLGFRKTGARRARFLFESLAALDGALRERGSRLLVVAGRAAERLPALAAAAGASRCSAQAEHTREELDEEAGLTLERFEGLTLIHPAALPFPVARTPDVFGAFRRAVEKRSAVREPLPAPGDLPPWPAFPEPEGVVPIDAGDGFAAAFAAAGFTAAEAAAARVDDGRSAFPFAGGEAAGRARLEDYVHGRALVATYKKTRNGLLGEAYSSKLSPWLANGSLSPRRVQEAVRTFEARHGGNESTYWLLFELLWRDFFRFQAQKVGDRLFHRGGIRGLDRRWRGGREAFARWRESRSGHAFIDANLAELAATGWMSNRGRQNAASWLVRDLDVDWRWGAAWFEHHLLDHDPCSNYGNWQYVAGVGHDPRGDRRFDPDRQAWTYDRQGHFVRTWMGPSAEGPGRRAATLFDA